MPRLSEARIIPDPRSHAILLAQIRLLYANANVGVGVTLLAATILAWLQWGTVSSTVVLGWWIYMVLVSVSRYTLVWRYHRVSPESNDIGRWRAAFVAGAAFAGIGWGAAGILLYPPAHLTNQVFLVFVLGGMMLGAATLLYPRPEAFLAFLIPTGLAPSFRLLLQGDETHLAMGLLAAVFTLATLITTGRIYVSVESSLQLQHENRDLVDDLNAAKSETEALNQALELRVEERTAELSRSTEQLREEIAHREQVEEELLRARKLESLGVLAGGIAHDFNNFLTVVQGYIEMAKTNIKAGEPVHEFLAGAASACQRAKFLSSQLLTFAKGGAPVRRLTSVSSLVTDAVHLARAGTPISIELLIAEDLRSAEVDPGQISQVLHNILLNARQAMPHGGGIIEVRAENAIRDNSGNSPWIRISIRDYGGGIPADVLSRIFDPYFTTKPGSSGLGLATSYAIVAKHGGHLSVESRPGHGTTFTIDLPASFETPPPQAAEPAADLHRGAERLLVMDDEEALRTLLHSVLGGLGYEVVTARDGAEAIARYEEAKATAKGYDAVLLDLTVSGGMGGLEAAAQLRELDPSVKLIVSSGYSDSPVLSDFAGYGFDAVIPKPWTTAELSEVFRRVLIADRDRAAD